MGLITALHIEACLGVLDRGFAHGLESGFRIGVILEENRDDRYRMPVSGDRYLVHTLLIHNPTLSNHKLNMESGITSKETRNFQIQRSFKLKQILNSYKE